MDGAYLAAGGGKYADVMESTCITPSPKTMSRQPVFFAPFFLYKMDKKPIWNNGNGLGFHGQAATPRFPPM
jgi:hypothetical protein